MLTLTREVGTAHIAHLGNGIVQAEHLLDLAIRLTHNLRIRKLWVCTHELTQHILRLLPAFKGGNILATLAAHGPAPGFVNALHHGRVNAFFFAAADHFPRPFGVQIKGAVGHLAEDLYGSRFLLAEAALEQFCLLTLNHRANSFLLVREGAYLGFIRLVRCPNKALFGAVVFNQHLPLQTIVAHMVTCFSQRFFPGLGKAYQFAIRRGHHIARFMAQVKATPGAVYPKQVPLHLGITLGRVLFQPTKGSDKTIIPGHLAFCCIHALGFTVKYLGLQHELSLLPAADSLQGAPASCDLAQGIFSGFHPGRSSTNIKLLRYLFSHVLQVLVVILLLLLKLFGASL